MAEDTVYRAAWIIADPWTIIENGYVRINDNAIAEVGQGRGPADAEKIIDCGPGVILPGLINAHTHLELSALKGAAKLDGGLIDWVESVIHLRGELDTQSLIDSAAEGLDSIRTTGTLLIGEIASLDITRGLFDASPIAGVWFREYLGTDCVPEQVPDADTLISGKDKRFSVAGHAPHTTAPNLLVTLKKMADQKGLTFGLHLAESAAEVEFLTKGQGEWADFMGLRGIDTHGWPVSGKHPVAYCDALNLLDEHTLAVHLLECDSKDFSVLANRGVRVCLCPRSNQLLHGKLPDIPTLLESGIRPCLGTDSLASNRTLSLFDEIQFVARKFPTVSPGAILSMATVNGAAALGFENRYGRLCPGARPDMLYLPLTGCTKTSLLEEVVHRGKDFEITLLSN